MSSTRARKERNIQDRVSESLTEGDKSLIADLKRFSDDSGSESGDAGGSVNNSPTSPAGNYLARKGDAMIGAFALSPPLDFTIDINSDNTIDISPLNGNNQYTSNVQLDDVPTSTTLNIIAGATFDGQILILRTFAPNPITISQGTVNNGGNIQTPDSNDVILGDLQMVILVFDQALVINENTGGTWRLLNTFGTGGGGGSGYNLIQDEGVSQPQRTTIDFVGSGVTASDGGNKTIITIPGGASSFPIRPPVTTGLPTTGNVILNLNQTSGHYFTIGELTGDIDISITNPPAANTAQAFRINIIKGATDFTVTFNDTLLVEPFIGEENSTTLLAGDIYDGSVFNIFTMTSTAGAGAPVEQWSTFPALTDVNMATFDLFNIDNLVFTTGTGSLLDVEPGFTSIATGGLRANFLSGAEFRWTEENITLMQLFESSDETNLKLTGVLSSAINLLETTTNKSGTILQGSTTLQYSTSGTQHEFIVGTESIARITDQGIIMQGTNTIKTPQIGFSQLGNIIQDDVNGMIFDVIPTDDFTWRNGVTQGDIFATLDVDGLFLNKLFIQFTSIASPGVTGSTNVGELFMDTDNNDHLSIIRNGSVIDLESGGGGGANTTLSNLTTTTAVNVPLLPDTTGRDFGSVSNSWDGFFSNLFMTDNGQLPSTSFGEFERDGNAVGLLVNEFVLINTITGGSGTANFVSYRNDTDASSGDELGSIRFDGNNSTNVQTQYAQVLAGIGNVSDFGILTLRVRANNSGLITGLQLDGDNNSSLTFLDISAQLNANLIPVSSSTVNLGSSSNQYNDIWIDGNANIDTLTNSTPIAVTADLDLAFANTIDWNQTASNAGSSSQTLPANPEGFLVIKVNSVSKRVPFYPTS